MHILSLLIKASPLPSLCALRPHSLLAPGRALWPKLKRALYTPGPAAAPLPSGLEVPAHPTFTDARACVKAAACQWKQPDG